MEYKWINKIIAVILIKKERYKDIARKIIKIKYK